MDRERELQGCVFRIKSYAMELFSMEEELLGIDDEESWDLVGRDVRLKAIFLYLDLNRVISGYESQERKNALSALANKLFYFMGELSDAVKSRSVPLAQECYDDTADALREVVADLVPSVQPGPHLEEEDEEDEE